jgi:hypothetical protein
VTDIRFLPRVHADFPVAGPQLQPKLFIMTKLAEIQEAILHLDTEQKERLRIWLDGTALDLEQDSPELEAELLKAVQGPHSPLVRGDLEAVARKALRGHRARRSA